MKKNKKSLSAAVPQPTKSGIPIEGKNDIILCKKDIEDISLLYIAEIIKSIDEENNRMKEKYFKINEQVASTERRTFFELLKKYFEQKFKGVSDNQDVVVYRKYNC